MSVKYRSNDQNAGAIPVDTTIKTTNTADGQVQHVNVDSIPAITGTVSVDNFPATQPVSGTVAATIADGSDVTLGAKADAAAATDTETATLIALMKRLLQKLQVANSSNLETNTLAVVVPDSVSTTVQNAITVVGSDGVDQPYTANPVPVAGRASTAAPTAVNADGDVQNVWLSRRGAVQTELRGNDGGTIYTTYGGSSEQQTLGVFVDNSTLTVAAHGVYGTQSIDSPLVGQPPLILGGRASTATPSAVSADGDVQNVWLTREGKVQINSTQLPTDLIYGSLKTILTGPDGGALSMPYNGGLEAYVLGHTLVDPTLGEMGNRVRLSNNSGDVLTSNFMLDVARGAVTGFTHINKFGEAPSGVQTTATDIWSRADSTPTQQIWLAPTAARTHAIVSTSTNDDGNPVGTGARTIRIYGLKTWATAESSEDITLDGTTPVNTANSYVIIHRMKVLTCGSSGPNVGTITATAATDSTVTATILPGDGQTEMAIYGVPSTQTAYVTRWTGGIDKASAAAATIEFQLRVNENPNVQTTAFLRKDDLHVQSNGSGTVERVYSPPVKFAGPCIIKVQGSASAADTDGNSGFDLVLVTN